MTRAFGLLLSLLLVTPCLGCAGDGTDSITKPDPNADTPLGGDATSKALSALLAPDVDNAPARYAIFQSPNDGQAFTSSDPPPQFAWQDVEASTQKDTPAPPPASLDQGELTGRAYLLALQIEGTDTVMQAFTTDVSFTPDAATWANVVGAGSRPVSAWVLQGDFDHDALVPGSGPFKGPWIALGFNE